MSDQVQPQPQQQMIVKNIVKQYQVITADNAEQMGLSIQAMLLVNAGWQMHGNLGCVAKGNGLEYFQGFIQIETIMEPMPQPTPPTPAVEGEPH